MPMKYFRIEIELESAILTPLHSGTLYGQLCWAYRTLYGVKALEDWLREQETDPFLLSGAMPRGYLPRPLLAPMTRGGKLSLGEIDNSKRLRKIGWVKKDDFAAIRRGLSEAALMGCLMGYEKNSPSDLRVERRAHNTIDRLSGTTPDAGGLYFVDESWPNETSGNGRLDVYAGTSMDGVQVGKLFAFMGGWGFGRDASTGKGRWSCRVVEESGTLFGDDSVRRMSLSHGSLTPNMQEPRYKLHVHYGKVGGGYAITSNPFKYPMTLLRPGATFRPTAGGPRMWGEMLRNVHPEKNWIVQQAQHLTVGYSEGKDA